MIDARKFWIGLTLARLTLAAPASAANIAGSPDEIRAYFNAAGYRQAQPSARGFLEDLYRIVLRREPDPAGFANWLSALRASPPVSRRRAIEEFLRSREFRSLPAAAGAPTSPREIRTLFSSPEYAKLKRSNEGFLYDAYVLILRREPDAYGLSRWLAALRGSPRPSRADVLDRFLSSKEYRATHPAADPPPPADASRNPGNTVFDEPGLLVADSAGCTVDACGAGDAAKLRAAGVRWLALQIHNSGPASENVLKAVESWAAAWRREGLRVGFWGVSYGAGAAAGDARLAARLTARYGGEFYIADCEGAFQDGEGDPAENRAFVSAFEAESKALGIGDLPRALSSMGRVALDMRPWIDGGWDALPQAYWNEYDVYQPSLSVKFYTAWGWPSERIHPTLATYAAPRNPQGFGLAAYAADLRSCGTRGFSFYLPENYLTPEDVQVMGSLR